MHLNIGSGQYPLKGWKNIDKDPIVPAEAHYDVRNGIREEDNSVEGILLSHILMYLRIDQTSSLSNECYRVLKDDGVLKVTEDNKHFKKRTKKQQKQYGEGVLTDRFEMESILYYAGFREIKEVEPFKETKQHLELPSNYPLATGRPTVYFLEAVKKTRKMSREIYLALDDFGEKNSSMDLLWRLKDYFSDFKVNLLAIPNECLRTEWMDYIRSIPWIQLCVHGYNHVRSEEIDEKVLNRLAEIGFAKVYKAPFWELNNTMYQRLKKLGFKVLLYKNDERGGIKFNWEIDSNPPELKEIHGYGHIYPHDYRGEKGGTGSSLFYFFNNILKLAKDIDFRFY